MFLLQVAEQVGGGGAEHDGHSGTLHLGEQMLFLMFLVHVAEQVGGGGAEHDGHSGTLH
jgi:hypothetical protein